MEIRILGCLDVVHEGVSLPVTEPKQCALLALLTVYANEVLSPDRIIDELWGDAIGEHPRKLLQAHISKLRTSLGPLSSMIVTHPTGYMLDAAASEIDADRFEALAARGRALAVKAPQRAAALFCEAEDLWHGPALDGVDEPFARVEAIRLEELRLSILEERFGAELRSCSDTGLIADLQAAVANHPLRERLRAHLMLALYRAGRQAEALRVFTDTRDTLGTQLGIEPSTELAHLEEQILLHDPALVGIGKAGSGSQNLPARIDSFVGREATLHALVETIVAHRLVTLTGVGGVGKTSLAIEVAREVAGGFTDGARLVELSTIREPDEVAPALAAALGLPERPGRPIEDSVVEHLARRDLLVVLDNCEHVVDACTALVNRVLRFCDDVRVLATSRVPLGVGGELVWRVKPLDTPGETTVLAIPELVSVGSVRLFMDRAGETTPGFIIRPYDAEAAATICRMVGGIPLAVEMAAARTSTLSLSAIVDRLTDSPDVLKSRRRAVEPRQRTMLATLEWSYDLLSAEEQTLFDRLGVFPGSFSSEAAQEICSAAPLILESLVSASLVRRESAGPVRFRMLEPVRAFAVARLDATGDCSTMRERHVRHFSSFANEAFRHQRGAFQPEAVSDADAAHWHSAIERDLPNLRTAMDWAIRSGDLERALQIVVPLGGFWYIELRVVEASDRLGAVLDDDRCPDNRLRCIALQRLALIQASTGDHEHADRTLEVAVGLAERLTLASGMAGLLIARAEAALARGDVVAGIAFVEKSVREARRDGDPRLVAYLYNLGYSLTLVGEIERVADIVEEVASLDANEPYLSVSLRGRIAEYNGNHWEAAEYFRHAFDDAPNTFHRIRNSRYRSYALLNLGELEEAAAIAVDIESAMKGGGLYEVAERASLTLGLIALRSGDTESGRSRFLTIISDAQDRGDRYMVWTALFAVAEWLAVNGDWDDAARLLGYCAERTKRDCYDPAALDCEPHISFDLIAEHMDEDVIVTLESQGAALSCEQMATEVIEILAA